MSDTSTDQEHSLARPWNAEHATLPRFAPYRPSSEYSDMMLRRIKSQLLPHPDSSAVIGVAGCCLHQGVTTTAVNLAVRAADHSISPTLLVDANLQHSSISKIYRCMRPGLSDCLAQDSTLEACARKTSIRGLHVVGLGSRRRIRDGAFGPDRVRMFCQEVRNECRFVVMDLPPLSNPAHIESFVPHLDGLLLTARYGVSKKLLADVQGQVRSFGGDLLGVIMIGERTRTRSWWRRFL